MIEVADLAVIVKLHRPQPFAPCIPTTSCTRPEIQKPLSRPVSLEVIFLDTVSGSGISYISRRVKSSSRAFLPGC